MKVILVNGSPHKEGCTYTALTEVEKELNAAGIETEIFWLGTKPISGCLGCGACCRRGPNGEKPSGLCVIDDIVNELAPKLEACDGVVVGSPVYYAAANSTLTALLDRLFYSTRFDKRMKVGASVAVARRGGCSATFDQLNKYFTISGMPGASSQYWNSVHGALAGEAAQDEEGLQTMRTLANNMVFLMRSIALGKEKYGLPEKEKFARTNFIR